MKWYWVTRVELIFTLKENVTSSSLAAPMVKTEQVEGAFAVDVEDPFLREPKE